MRTKLSVSGDRSGDRADRARAGSQSESRSDPRPERRWHAENDRRQRRPRSVQSLLSGSRHQRTPVCHLSSTQRRVDDYAPSCADTVRRDPGRRSDLHGQRRIGLRRQGRCRRRSQGGVHHAAHERRDPDWHRCPGQRRIRRDRGRRSASLRRAASQRVDVPPAAAVHQPRIPECGHVGRPRIAADEHHSAGSRAPVERRHSRSRAGAAPAHAVDTERNRPVRNRAVHGTSDQQRRRQPQRGRRDGWTGRDDAAAVLHRHQRSSRTESVRRRLRSERVHAVQTPGLR